MSLADVMKSTIGSTGTTGTTGTAKTSALARFHVAATAVGAVAKLNHKSEAFDSVSSMLNVQRTMPPQSAESLAEFAEGVRRGASFANRIAIVNQCLSPGESIIELVSVFKEQSYTVVVTNLRIIWAVTSAGQLLPRRECSLLFFIRCDRPSSSSSSSPPFLRLCYIRPPTTSTSISSTVDSSPQLRMSLSSDHRSAPLDAIAAAPPPRAGNFLSRSLFKVLNRTTSRQISASAAPSASQIVFVQELPPIPAGGYTWSGCDDCLFPQCKSVTLCSATS